MLPYILAAVTVVALNLYVVLGGADFGGGVWDLLAAGPRRDRQRALVAEAIGPIWEANHVWLVLVLVLLFTCFSPVFALLSIALHVPLTVALIGIVLRGSAFTFRSYGARDHAAQRRWGWTFAIASLVTPVVLGISFGAVASERVGMTPAATCLSLRGQQAAYRACAEAAAANGPRFYESFVAPWLNAFSFSVGVLTLVLFALLAAVYLTVEAADDEALREDFRRRALASALAAFVAAAVSLLLAPERLRHALTATSWALAFHVATALAAVTALAALWTRRYRLARAAAVAQVSLIFWGWAVAQLPYLVPPALTVESAASSDATLRPLLWALVAGALILVPSLAYLLRVFKGQARAPHD